MKPGLTFAVATPVTGAGLALVWLAALLLGGVSASGDVALLLLLHADAQTARTLLTMLTHLGGFALLSLVTLAAAGYLLVRKRWTDLALLLAITLGGRLLIEAQKALLARPRPVLTEQLVLVWSKSFPSAHAGNSMIVYVTLALLLTRGRAGLAAALALSLAIGLSRVALGVHWPSDVIAGWAFGALWVALVYSAAAGRLGAR